MLIEELEEEEEAEEEVEDEEEESEDDESGFRFNVTGSRLSACVNEPYSVVSESDSASVVRAETACG